MNITNNQNLPMPLVNAVKNDEYSKGGADYSVSQLINPTQQTILFNRYESQLTEDVSDSIWKLFGKGFHMLMEKHGGKHSLTEERLFMEIGGRKISGAPDWYDGEKLWDWKTTKAYARKSRLAEWTKQVNAYRFLLEHYGFKVSGTYIMALYKDWRKSEALKDPNYPQKDSEVIEIEKWTNDITENYLSERVKKLVANEKVIDDNLPECTKEEMWTREEAWVVVKKGKTRAINGGVKFSKEDAEKVLGEQKKPEENEIIHRPGIRARCEGYCSVSEFCSQRMKFKIENGIEELAEVEA